MMKNTIIRLFVCMVMGTMLIAASRPSIEGRASVAESGELPPGMYIKAHTFLPGDSVIITNPATKVSIEVFVFETIDEGVAAIVSDEVAEKLFITNNSDTLVQIRKVVAHAEINSSGLEIVEEDIIVVETPIEEEIIDDSELFVPEIVNEDIPVEVVALAEPMIEEEVLEEAEVEEEIIEEVEAVSNELPESTEEIILVEEDPQTDHEIIEVTEEAIVQEEEILTEAVIEEEIIENDPLVNEITDIIVSTESEPTEEDGIIFTPFADMTALFAGEEAEIEENPIEVEDIVTTETEASDIVLEEIPEVAIVAEEPAVDEPIEEVIAVEEIPEVAIVVEEPVVEEEIIEVVDFPNTLTPTEENPPVFEGIKDEPIVTLYTSPSEEIIEEAVEEVETIDIFALTPATEYVEESTAFTVNMQDFIEDSISIVGAKKYYVQLATYKDEKNILTLLEKYSEKYPLALVESTIIQDAYQVFVGPLTKDEYTVVLERFKTFGYKDAFLKIAN